MQKKIIYIFSIVLFLASCKVSKKTAPSSTTKTSEKTSAKESPKESEKSKKQKEHIRFMDAEVARLSGDNSRKAIKLYSEYLSTYTTNATAYFNIARLYFQVKEIDNAIKNAEKATRLDPDNKFFQELYIQLLVYNKDTKQAESQFNTLISKNPNNDEYIYKKAMLYVKSKEYEKAIETFNELEKKTGFNEDIILQKKSLYERLDKTEQAVAELKKLREYDPSSVQYTIMMIDVYEAASQKEKAKDIYKELEDKYPNHPLAQVALAQYYLENNNSGEYSKFMQKIIKNKNLDAETKIGLLIPSIQKLESDTTAEKEQVFEMAKTILTDAPNNKDALALYASVLYYGKKYDEALVEFKRYLLVNKANFEVWNSVMSIYFDKQQYDSVIEYGNQCVENFPNNPMPYYFIGISHSQKKETDKAIKSLNKAADLEPENPALYTLIFSSLGEVYNSIKNYEYSDSCFESALRIQPNDATTLNNFAYYLSLRKNKLDKAETMSKKSLEIQPNSKSFLDTYGWILFQQGKYTEAKDYIERAIKAGGEDDGTLYEHLGDIYYKLNDGAKAKENWNKASQKGENNPILNKKIKEGVWYEE